MSHWVDELRDARARLSSAVEDLSDDQWRVPPLDIVNPILWEVGHVAWFQERWVLRHVGGRDPVLADVDVLYDSSDVLHDTRWDLALPSRSATLDYMERVLAAVCSGPVSEDPREDYFRQLALYHEDMHVEALLYTRQTCGYPAPAAAVSRSRVAESRGTCPGDADIPGGRFVLGATPDDGFVFDNEKWGHQVDVAPFRIARAAVTQAEFATFVDAGGYAERRFWCEAGWRWRAAAGASCPAYWRRAVGGGWERRHFERWQPLDEDHPMVFVNWYEASAFCRWAGRRLPTEAEWEFAASMGPGGKRRFPWGDDVPTEHLAHLDGRQMTCTAVGDRPAGDSAFGCRQMIGNVWEWTASAFEPYPGFVVDPYEDYSRPWFGSRRVLRGGAFASRGRMLRNTWRNFFTPDRRDVFAGFRTCAV